MPASSDFLRIASGVRFERTDGDIYLCHGPDGSVVSVLPVEVFLAESADGTRTLRDLCHLAHQKGYELLLPAANEIARRLQSAGVLIEDPAPPVPTEPPPPTSAPPVRITPISLLAARTAEARRPPSPLPGRAITPPAFTAPAVPAAAPPELLDEPPTIIGFAPADLPSLDAPSLPPGPLPREEGTDPNIQVSDDLLRGVQSLSIDKGGGNNGSAPVMTGAPSPARGGGLESLALSKSGGPTPPSPSPGGFRAIHLVALAVVAAAAVGAGVLWKRPPPPPPVTKPRIEAVRRQESSGALMAAGFIEAVDEIRVGALPGMRIHEVMVQNGDMVKQGQPLVQLEAGELKAQLQLATAKLNVARRNLARQKELVNSNVGSLVQLDQARGEADIAQAEVTVIARRLEQMTVRSPIAGRVLDVPVHAGEVTGMSEGAFTVVKLADLSKLVAVVQVPEDKVLTLRVAQAATVTSDVLRDQTLEGTIREIHEEGDRARGTVAVEVEFRQVESQLRPGMSVKVQFKPHDDDTRLFVPRGALDGSNVWVLEQGAVQRRSPGSKRANGWWWRGGPACPRASGWSSAAAVA